MLVFTGVSKRAVLAYGSVEFLHRFPCYMGIGFYHHLGYAVAVVYSKVVFTEVNKYDSYFTAIIGIDCARGIDNRDSVVEGKTGSGSYLAFIT